MAVVKLVYIRWLDAQGDHGQQTKEELDAMQALPLETAGFLVSEDDDVVRLSTDMLHFDGLVKYRDTNVIPKMYIQDMQVIEVKSEAKK